MAKEHSIDLFRGYIPATEGAQLPTRSRIGLDELASSKRNPHDIDLADHLLWVSPDKTYAKHVVLSRYLIQQALRNVSALPRLAVIEAPSTQGMYGANGKTLEHIDPADTLPNQIVVQDLENKTVIHEELTMAGKKTVEQFLHSTGQAEAMWRAVTYLEDITGVNYVTTVAGYKTVDQLPLMQAITGAYEYYTAQGIDPKQAEDLLAKGFFVLSAEFSNMADQCEFQDIESSQ